MVRVRVAAISLVAVACVAGAAGSPALASPVVTDPRPGEVVASSPLRQGLWIPGATRKAFLLKYGTTNAHDEPALSTGTVFLPKGKAPRGGWPVLSWAHGTSGLGDGCAPSRIGPTLPARDWPYLANWLQQGYAIVASDYVGLGTPGLAPYLRGRSTAHNVVDMVKAGRRFARRNLPERQQLASKWVAIGQSQGGGAAIYTARFATQFGGKRLDYRGAVGTGVPAHIERLILLVGPKMPPVALTPGITAYLSYIFASLRNVHPELGINEILTPVGRKYLRLAKTECVLPFEEKLKGVNVGDFFTAPVATLPGFAQTVRAYMGMPESGFDRPFFMGHGLLDLDVPFASTEIYVATLQLNGEPVTFKAYASDHSGTLIQSQRDTIPFVRGLFAGG